MSEELVIRHCSPTLAGLKTGSLFSCAYEEEKRLWDEIRCMNRKLVSKGLRILPLRLSGQRVLLYLYRPQRLQRDWERCGARSLLEQLGYSPGNAGQCVRRLMGRLKQESFPHEIGLFLGYPPEDVRGFLEQGAAGAKGQGYWKVYGDVASAQRVFARYRKCTAVYCAQWGQGKPLERLIVTEHS